MLANPIFIWLVIGVILFISDNFISRYDLKKAYYAAFVVAGLLLMGVMREPNELIASISEPSNTDISAVYLYFIIGQIVIYLGAFAAVSFVLRDATPKSTLGKSKEFYDSIIGKTVEVAENGINSISGGKIILDGEIFQAKLPRNYEEDSIEAGTKMLVKEIIGDTFVVTVKE
ncbi:MAG: NfeD family protein [Rickettsiales bacterium]|jgi:H+/gluconate symporter-like permease